MKRLLVLVLALLLSLPVFAHSGRTDSKGGHNGPGGYHYHHGYPAHQHEGGECPYDFDDRTGESSGTSSSGSSSSNSSSNKNTKPENDGLPTWVWAIILLLSIAATIFSPFLFALIVVILQEIAIVAPDFFKSIWESIKNFLKKHFHKKK